MTQKAHVVVVVVKSEEFPSFVILQGAVTHKDRTDKSSETFTWTAPSDLRADVIFRLQQKKLDSVYFLNFQIVHHCLFSQSVYFLIIMVNTTLLLSAQFFL